MKAPKTPAEEFEVRQRLKDDLPHYAAKCLKVRTKAGRVVPLKLNAVQRFIHEKLELQKKNTGRVRALILKARQPGVSTYVAARFYWRVTHGRGRRAFILTHREQATANLFAMAKRFHRLRQGGGGRHRCRRHHRYRRPHHAGQRGGGRHRHPGDHRPGLAGAQQGGLIVLRILALAAALTLAGCQALWDLPSQMREPYGSSGSPPPAIPNQDEEESLS